MSLKHEGNNADNQMGEGLWRRLDFSPDGPNRFGPTDLTVGSEQR